MADSIDNLTRRWRARPDAVATAALCDTLRLSSTAGRVDLVDEIARVAAERHGANGQVLLSVARLFVASGRLPDAQSTLVSAGRVAPRDAAIFRLLGEVLLRRGDAERAEKVLDRAIKLGARDVETSQWMDRARAMKPLQAQAGARAVAAEIANVSARSGPVALPSDLAPARPPVDTISQEEWVAESDDPVTAVAGPSPGSREGFGLPTEVSIPRGVLSFPRDIPADAPLELPGAPGPRPPLRPPAVSPSAAPIPPPAPPPRAPPPKVSPPKAPPPSRESSPGDITAELPVPDVHAAPTAVRPAPVPAANDVLAALRNAGVFEPSEVGTGAAEWQRPASRISRRAAKGLVAALAGFVVAAVVSFGVLRAQKAAAQKQADDLLAHVETDLDSGKASLLAAAEQSIGRAFELDSRSARAATAWLHERAVKGLLQGGADVAFEDAIARAVEVKVPDEKVAFARVAAFLFQGDTAGAAGLLTRWDSAAAREPLYQLVAGSTLDHAGDTHAIARYQAAAAAAPALVLAQVLLARAVALEGDPSEAAALARQFRSKYPDRVDGPALTALAWARGSVRDAPPTAEISEVSARAGELPLPLYAVPRAVDAVMALDRHAPADARSAIEKGLGAVDDPAMAAWLGSLALETHDEALVRKAALLAVRFSAVYGPARVLAGRVALLEGRLDDAMKAIEDLDSASPPVAVVRAAVAYERADIGAVEAALGAAGRDDQTTTVLAALRTGAAVLRSPAEGLAGSGDVPARLLALGRGDAAWGDLVAIDAALDLGLTDVGDAIRSDWKGSEDKPLHALRLSRLARYEDHLDDADRFSKIAIDGATVTPRVLTERVLVLAAQGHGADIEALLTRYPLVSGPTTLWLRVYALAANGRGEEARKRAAALDVPGPATPQAGRVVAALALAAVHDKKRAEPLIRAALDAGSADSDLLAAATAVAIALQGAGRKR